MVTGDQTNDDAPAPGEQQPPKKCRSAWHDGKSGHVCGEPAGHDGPHICATDNARYGQKPAPEPEDPNRRFGYFPG